MAKKNRQKKNKPDPPEKPDETGKSNPDQPERHDELEELAETVAELGDAIAHAIKSFQETFDHVRGLMPRLDAAEQQLQRYRENHDRHYM